MKLLVIGVLFAVIQAPGLIKGAPSGSASPNTLDAAKQTDEDIPIAKSLN
jgi:hypothetical protein